MKKITLTLITTLAIALLSGMTAFAQTTYATGVNLSVPDASTTGVSSVINVPLSGILNSNNEMRVEIAMSHGFAGDVRITLESPSGTLITLMNDVGGVSGPCGFPLSIFGATAIANFGFEDNSGTNITTCPGTNGYFGFYEGGDGNGGLPSDSSLDNFWTEDVQGDWTLTVYDDENSANGSLNETGFWQQWSIRVPFADNPPTAVCADYTAQLDAAGNVTITAADIDGGSSDTEGPVTLSVSQDTFTCADIGANMVTLTVTDNIGQTDTCMATVTVEDNVPPVALCQESQFNWMLLVMQPYLGRE